MLDLLFITEFFWCIAWMGQQSTRKAILFAGGLATSLYASLSLTDWFTLTFLPPASPVLEWAVEKLSHPVARVAVSHLVNVPVAAVTGYMPQIIVYNIARITFFGVGATAVFSVFAGVAYLIDAFRDGLEQSRRSSKVLAYTVGCCTGIALILLTTIAVTDLGVINPSSLLETQVSNSTVMSITSLFWTRLGLSYVPVG